MSIRTRLTLSFGLLAALCVLAAAIVGYRSTSGRVRNELDGTLRAGAARAASGQGPGGRFCSNDVVPIGGERRRFFDAPGSRVQCIDAKGTVINTGGSGDGAETTVSPLPVDDTDKAIAKKRVNEQAPAAPLPGVRDGDRTPGGRGGGGNDPATLRAVRFRTVTVDSTDLRVATAAIAGGGAVMLARDLDESSRVLGGLRSQFALIGAIVTLAAAAIGALVARAFARPVHALTAVTESIAAEGALSDAAAIDPSILGRRDELGRLANSFSSMLASLRGSRRQQRQLAQDAGHELRTPLTTLRTNVEVLAKYPNLAPEKRAVILREMDDEIRELSTLTDELLVLATDATPDDPVVELDLADLARRAVSRLERRTGRTVHADLEPTPLHGRRLQLNRAIDNLLNNAAKFDQTDKPIEITVRPGATVAVRDHGPGFVTSDLTRVFDRFYRSEAARQLPGTGLGLSIVAEAARAHGGKASASNHPDGGAVVSINVISAVTAGSPATPVTEGFDRSVFDEG